MPRSSRNRSASPQKMPGKSSENCEGHQQIDKDGLCEQIQEMFQESVEPEVIRLVLSECEWRVDEAIETLFSMRNEDDFQNQNSASKLDMIACSLIDDVVSDSVSKSEHQKRSRNLPQHKADVKRSEMVKTSKGNPVESSDFSLEGEDMSDMQSYMNMYNIYGGYVPQIMESINFKHESFVDNPKEDFVTDMEKDLKKTSDKNEIKSTKDSKIDTLCDISVPNKGRVRKDSWEFNSYSPSSALSPDSFTPSALSPEKQTAVSEDCISRRLSRTQDKCADKPRNKMDLDTDVIVESVLKTIGLADDGGNYSENNFGDKQISSQNLKDDGGKSDSSDSKSDENTENASSSQLNLSAEAPVFVPKFSPPAVPTAPPCIRGNRPDLLPPWASFQPLGVPPFYMSPKGPRHQGSSPRFDHRFQRPRQPRWQRPLRGYGMPGPPRPIQPIPGMFSSTQNTQFRFSDPFSQNTLIPNKEFQNLDDFQDGHSHSSYSSAAGKDKPQAGLVKASSPAPIKLDEIPCNDQVERVRSYVGQGKLLLVLLRGLPGSGKSFLARKIVFDGVVLSTDDFFYRCGEYNYRQDQLSEAHEWNKSRARDAMERRVSPIIIDNTNTMEWEMFPYVKLAVSRGYKVEVFEPNTPWKFQPKMLTKKNSHGVTRDTIKKMNDRYQHDITAASMVAKAKQAGIQEVKETKSPIVTKKSSNKQPLKLVEYDASSDEEMANVPQKTAPSKSQPNPLKIKMTNPKADLKQNNDAENQKEEAPSSPRKRRRKKRKPSSTKSEVIQTIEEILQSCEPKSMSDEDWAIREEEIQALLFMSPVSDFEKKDIQDWLAKELAAVKETSARKGNTSINVSDVQTKTGDDKAEKSKQPKPIGVLQKIVGISQAVVKDSKSKEGGHPELKSSVEKGKKKETKNQLESKELIQPHTDYKGDAKNAEKYLTDTNSQKSVEYSQTAKDSSQSEHAKAKNITDDPWSENNLPKPRRCRRRSRNSESKLAADELEKRDSTSSVERVKPSGSSSSEIDIEVKKDNDKENMQEKELCNQLTALIKSKIGDSSETAGYPNSDVKSGEVFSVFGPSVMMKQKPPEFTGPFVFGESGFATFNFEVKQKSTSLENASKESTVPISSSDREPLQDQKKDVSESTSETENLLPGSKTDHSNLVSQKKTDVGTSEAVVEDDAFTSDNVKTEPCNHGNLEASGIVDGADNQEINSRDIGDDNKGVDDSEDEYESLESESEEKHLRGDDKLDTQDDKGDALSQEDSFLSANTSRLSDSSQLANTDVVEGHLESSEMCIPDELVANFSSIQEELNVFKENVSSDVDFQNQGSDITKSVPVKSIGTQVVAASYQENPVSTDDAPLRDLSVSPKQSTPKAKSKRKNVSTFLDEAVKQKFQSSSWSNFDIKVQNSSESKPDISKTSPPKQKRHTRNVYSFTSWVDFTFLNQLDSSKPLSQIKNADRYKVLLGKSRDINLENDLRKKNKSSNTDTQKVQPVFGLDKGCMTDEIEFLNIGDIEFLENTFPEANKEHLRETLDICQGNVEWALNLLLDWGVTVPFSSQEKEEISNEMKEKSVKKPAKAQSKSRIHNPRSLFDLCHSIINPNDLEKLQEKVISTGRQRLERMESHQYERVHSFSWSESKTSEDLMDSIIASSFNSSDIFVSPGKDLKDLSGYFEGACGGVDERGREESLTDVSRGGLTDRELQGQWLGKQFKGGRAAISPDVETIEDDQRTDRESGSTDRRKDESAAVGQDWGVTGGDWAVEEWQQTDRSMVDGEAHVKLPVPKELVQDLEELFGPVQDNLRDCYDFEVTLDLRTAKRLFDNLRRRPLQRRLSMEKAEAARRKQLQEDEALARRLQEEENSSVSRSSPTKRSGNRETKPATVFDHQSHRKRPAASNLRNIMEEQKVHQQRREEQIRVIEATGDRLAISTRLKRQKLYNCFPGVDENFLEEIFEANRFSLEDTVRVLQGAMGKVGVSLASQRSLLMQERPTGVQPRQTETDKQRCLDDLVEKSLHDHVNFDETALPEYDDIRGEASIHHQMRNECFHKAQEAFKRGMKDVAAFYSQQGHLHTQKLKEANMRASQKILEHRSNDVVQHGTLDLHGFHVDEAISILTDVIRTREEEFQIRPDRRKQNLAVITGRGRHSKGGVAKLRPAIINHLNNIGYRYVEEQPGLFRIQMKYRS